MLKNAYFVVSVEEKKRRTVRLTLRHPSGMLFCMQTNQKINQYNIVKPSKPYLGKKATRRAARTEAAIAAGRKTFLQLREEVAARDPDRYAFRNPGTRKTGMIAVNAIFTRK